MYSIHTNPSLYSIPIYFLISLLACGKTIFYNIMLIYAKLFNFDGFSIYIIFHFEIDVITKSLHSLDTFSRFFHSCSSCPVSFCFFFFTSSLLILIVCCFWLRMEVVSCVSEGCRMKTKLNPPPFMNICEGNAHTNTPTHEHTHVMRRTFKLVRCVDTLLYLHKALAMYLYGVMAMKAGRRKVSVEIDSYRIDLLFIPFIYCERVCMRERVCAVCK